MLKEPEEHVPLTPLSFHILLTLAQGPNHGYGLMKDIANSTGGGIRPATGTVYLALQRLEDEGFIEHAESPSDGLDERRRHYAITPYGRAVASAETARLATLVRLATERDLVQPPKKTQ